MQAAGDAVEGTMYFSLIVNFLLQASLSEIFALFEILQMIVLVPLFKIILPANAATFFKTLMDIAAFDFIENIEPLSWLVGTDTPSEPVNGNFEALGLETTRFLSNLGTQFYFFFVYIAGSVLTNFLVALKIGGTKVSNFHRRMHFGSLIYLMQKSYLMVWLCIFISLRYSFSPENASVDV